MSFWKNSYNEFPKKYPGRMFEEISVEISGRIPVFQLEFLEKSPA